MKKNILSVIQEKNKAGFNNQKKELITFLNPHSFKIARKNINVFKEFDRIFIDGFSLVKLLNFFKIGNHSRKSFDMSSLAGLVFENAKKNDLRVYFIGTEPGKIDKAVQVIKERFPKLNIVGYRDGFFNSTNDYKLEYQNIINSEAELTVVGMGTPLQEKFLIGLKNAGYKGNGYTCGGFFHQIIDGIVYFPNWSNKYNLRWLYRIIKEPEVALKRSTIGYIQFIFVFMYDIILFKLNKKKAKL